MKIRLATIDDARSMLDIYAQYMETSVTFEYELPTVEEFAGRIKMIEGTWPWLVLEKDGAIAGYSYGHILFERAAYQWNAELSIYLAMEMRGQRLGRRLYGALLALLARQNILDVYAKVTEPNSASERLHQAFGFRKIFIQPNAGFKAGKWHDVAWYIKNLGPHTAFPAPFKSLSDLDREELALMSNY